MESAQTLWLSNLGLGGLRVSRRLDPPANLPEDATDRDTTRPRSRKTPGPYSANVLWKYVQFFGYDRDAALQDLIDLRQLPWRSSVTRDLAQASLVLGLEYGIAAYDAAYVVLSGSVKVPLVTADEKLFRRLVDTDCDVHWLGDWYV